MNIDKCGYIAIIGRPNVGKSTLLNCILGKKISITSPKPQTTRGQILGIKTVGLVQAIYIDTPGIHRDSKNAINRYMNRTASSVIYDADVVIFLIDASKWTEEDELVLDKLKDRQAPVILAINKVDIIKDKRQLLPLIDKLQKNFTFMHIVPLSAKNAENVTTLESVLAELLPKGPHLFPATQVTDKTDRFQAAEIIREKVIRSTKQEIPYATGIEIEEYKAGDKIIEISAIIWVEREGQKPIVIGKDGNMLRKIGTHARKELELLLAKKVFLRLWVKVKNDWTNDDQALSHLGFD